MFIREVWKSNGTSKKKYKYLHLVESIRTPQGPRQRLVLNLGQLELEPSLHKILAQRIEEILTGQKSLFGENEKIEKIAQDVCTKIFQKQGEEDKTRQKINLQEVDLSSIHAYDACSLGPEYICHSVWNELEFDTVFTQNGISSETLKIIKAIIIGRLVEPASELHTYNWAETRSALYELIGKPERSNLSSFYLADDKIIKLKDKIEEHLWQKEKTLFDLPEKIFLFDLTNTYFEGRCKNNSKAVFGRSKEKRNDCRLETLGLIIDEYGYAKFSKLFPGNQYEASTLHTMISELSKHCDTSKRKIIVIDAGIATEENLKLIKEKGYSYIAVTRGKAPIKIDYENMTVFREDKEKGIKIEFKRYEKDKEIYLLCRSEMKKKKEEGMRTKVEQLFIEKLSYVKDGLTKPKRMKKYISIVEAIGRLKEKYIKASKLYDVKVLHDENTSMSKANAIDITWQKKEAGQAEEHKEGTYILRTDCTDLSNEEIWNTYRILQNIEEAFKNMKSHLGLRPNFHQIGARVDAHMFISVLAYHIQHSIESKLKKKGDTRCWATIRDILSTHERISIGFNIPYKEQDWKHLIIRLSTTPTAEQIKIYQNLSLSAYPLDSKKMEKISSDHKKN